MEDALPTGAVPAASGGDSWSWVTSPKYSGSKAHASANVAGVHQHYFTNAAQTLVVGANDMLFTWVYVDPASPPRQVMLQWYDGSWEHRAYWGENLLTWGTNGTNSRRSMGPLPKAGGWVRLEVPAAGVRQWHRRVRYDFPMIPQLGGIDGRYRGEELSERGPTSSRG